ncbi:ABC transporter ATP-binding protein [Xylanimonas oleitrophica]|uniref:ABC transporter ATP-binding protein n=1 Tax=Xylanimonas oleitrophica TaxID=2607479 RepID=A0A2W5WNN5_9MICO|nr:ABC transporter ATP-binding protein [Xylanimonas oleitrophica]PZR52967.1 ABC transporter ATP-binding protein [Xylanimonas oleitrophica]
MTSTLSPLSTEAPGTAARSAPGTAHAVTVEAVERTFATPTGPRQVLRGLDITLRAGEIVAIVGPSGCGKSTLLRQVSGLDTPTSGRILLDGTPVVATDPRTAVAFQEPRLLPWRTLAQNVALGLPRAGAGVGTRRQARQERDERVAELLRLVGLEASADLRPRQVSGGMAQRASLARALARNPGVLLLDEPFGALDALTRLRMQDLLLEIHAAQPTTVLLVTHDVEEALYLADRVLLLRSLATPSAVPGPAPGPAGSDAGSLARVVDVPGARPRDRADRQLAELRAELLEGLGVDTHHG